MANEDVKLSGARKAAVLLIALGDMAASEILKQLEPTDVQKITAEIAAVRDVQPETASLVLNEFGELIAAQEYVAPGGSSYASRLLEKAFGVVEGKRLMGQMLGHNSGNPMDLTELVRSDPRQLVNLIQEEQPQTIALILANLGGKAGSAMLELLPDNLRAPVIERLARMGHLSSQMVQRVFHVLQGKTRTLGGVRESTGVAGVEAVAGILNQMDSGASKVILDTLEKTDPELAISIRNVLFTFEDLLTVPDASVRDALGAIDKKLLATALKGAPEELKSHVMKGMSSRAQEMLKEDMEAMGPVRLRDVQKAQSEVVETFRNLEAEGKITLGNEEEDALVV